jgi:Rhodopirellula transposase DDE domain
MSTIAQMERKFELLRPLLNERQRRLWAAAEALVIGHGGITRAAAATGLDVRTLRAGLNELRGREAGQADPLGPDRVRRPGGGRKRRTEEDPTLLRDLEALIEPLTRGDPESPLRWTCKSTEKLAAELRAQGHAVSPRTVADLLHQLDYRLQGCRKTKEGRQHPDRDAQFHYINDRAGAAMRRGQPVISVDTKKKELVGEFKQSGREWQPAYEPVAVSTHDFPDPRLGKAIPYGVYDLAENAGWVSVGIDHDTAPFAVESIRRWWRQMGRRVYPGARELLVTADAGGSNGSRNRLWKVALQGLADELGLVIRVCHFPPGTSKWNKIEHRLFCHITTNWRGRPLTSHAAVVSLIAGTTTRAGLTIEAGLDTSGYPTGLKVTAGQMARVRLERDEFHGDWNYAIRPQEK